MLFLFLCGQLMDTFGIGSRPVDRYRHPHDPSSPSRPGPPSVVVFLFRGRSSLWTTPTLVTVQIPSGPITILLFVVPSSPQSQLTLNPYSPNHPGTVLRSDLKIGFSSSKVRKGFILTQTPSRPEILWSLSRLQD